jgi:hypothetical protein
MKTAPNWILALAAAAVVTTPVYAQSAANAPVVQLAPGTSAPVAPMETRIHTSMYGPTVSVPVRRGIREQEPIVSAPTNTASTAQLNAAPSAEASPQ